MHNIYGVAKSDKLAFDVWSSRIVDKDKKSAVDLVNTAMQSNGTFDTTFRIQANGKTKHIKANGEVMESDDGNKRMIGSNIDVTDWIEAQAELKNSNEDLEQFAYIASPTTFKSLLEPSRTISNCSR